MRPQFEYTATLWDPHTREKVEAVQRRAARFVTGDYPYPSSVTAMTESLSWETLHPTQKTASQGHYDVPHCTCHGGYTSLSTPTTVGCCYKRPPVQVQNPILQDQYIQRFPLPIKYQTVEPAARKADKC